MKCVHLCTVSQLSGWYIVSVQQIFFSVVLYNISLVFSSPVLFAFLIFLRLGLFLGVLAES